MRILDAALFISIALGNLLALPLWRALFWRPIAALWRAGRLRFKLAERALRKRLSCRSPAG